MEAQTVGLIHEVRMSSISCLGPNYCEGGVCLLNLHLNHHKIATKLCRHLAQGLDVRLAPITRAALGLFLTAV